MFFIQYSLDKQLKIRYNYLNEIIAEALATANLNRSETMESFYRDTMHVQDEELLHQVCEASSLIHIAKGETLFSAGEYVADFYFLKSGGIRGYYLDKRGREITDCIWFHEADAVAGRIGFDAPSMVSAVAFRDTTLIAIPYQKLMQIISRSFEGRDIYERLLITAANQHCEFKALICSCSAEERYEWFLLNYPDLDGQISERCIASFLCMNPVTLSRVRAKHKLKAEPQSQSQS